MHRLYFKQIYKSIETEAASELMKTLCSLVESMDRETSAELWNLVLTGCDKEPDFCLSVGMVTTVLNSRGGEPFVVDLSQVADRYLFTLFNANSLVRGKKFKQVIIIFLQLFCTRIA